MYSERFTDRDAEGGFTLVELLIAVTINGLIVGAIVSVCFVGLRLMNGQQRPLQQSTAEQVIAHRFSADVQEACSPVLSGAATCPRSPNPSTQTVQACGSPALFAVDSLSTATTASADVTLAWVLQDAELRRLTCSYGASTASASESLASGVQDAAVSYPASGACAGQFMLDVELAGSSDGDGTSAYAFSLCAKPRI